LNRKTKNFKLKATANKKAAKNRRTKAKSEGRIMTISPLMMKTWQTK